MQRWESFGANFSSSTQVSRFNNCACGPKETRNGFAVAACDRRFLYGLLLDSVRASLMSPEVADEVERCDELVLNIEFALLELLLWDWLPGVCVRGLFSNAWRQFAAPGCNSKKSSYSRSPQVWRALLVTYGRSSLTFTLTYTGPIDPHKPFWNLLSDRYKLSNMADLPLNLQKHSTRHKPKIREKRGRSPDRVPLSVTL